MAKRLLRALGTATFGALVVAVSIAFAQGGTPGGLPAQTDLYNDALTLARAIPFIVALGILFGIWQAKVTTRRPKSSPASADVIRHDWGAVISHWANGLGFILGMMSGGIILRWVARPDDLRIVFVFHFIGASLIVFGVASHLAQNAITGGMGLIPRSVKDITQGLAEVIGYSGVYGPEGAAFGINWPKGLRQPFAGILSSFGIAPPRRLGKFLPAEKVFSYLPWLIIIAVMLTTGLVKVLRYEYSIPPDFVAQMSSIHDIFTAIAVAMLIIHLMAVLLVPNHWPLVVSIFSTRIKRSYVAKHNPAWMKELEDAEKQAPARTAEPPAAAEQAKAT